MLGNFKSLDEARKYKYGKWAGCPQGHAYVEGRCAYEACSNDRAMMFFQCNRKNGHGQEGMYCKQHAKMVEPEKYPPPKPRKKSFVDSLIDSITKLQEENEELKKRIQHLEEEKVGIDI